MNDQEDSLVGQTDLDSGSIVIEACKLMELQLAALHLDQMTFQGFTAAVNRSPETAATHFPHSIATWYAQSVLVRLRRIGDRDSKSLSFYNLLKRMLAHPEQWTLAVIQKRWHSQPHPYDEEMLLFFAENSYFVIADSLGKNLNTARVQDDVVRLSSALERVKRIVDRTIAHVDARGAEDVSMTYNDVGEVIDEIEAIALPYIALLTGRGYSSLKPVDQTNWTKIFETWI